MKLTPKQKAFCDYYLETGNATESAKRAGYSEKTARAIGEENLTKPDIRNYINEQASQKDRERIASQDEVLEFLTSIVRGQIKESLPVVLQRDFEMIDKTPSIKDRLKAAELLGKRYGLFKEQIHHSGEIKRIIIVEDFEDDE